MVQRTQLSDSKKKEERKKDRQKEEKVKICKIVKCQWNNIVEKNTRHFKSQIREKSDNVINMINKQRDGKKNKHIF